METASPEKHAIKNALLLPALCTAIISTWLVVIVFQIQMVDIATEFNVPIGTTSMAASVGSITGIFVCLLLAVVSIRYNHKHLLLLGVTLNFLGGVGYYLAPTFPALLLANIGIGSGMGIVNAMVYSLIGDNYPLEKRGRAVGAIVASGTIATLIASPSVAAISSFGDWRTAILLLAIPFALVSLVAVVFVVPFKPRLHVEVKKESFMVGCRKAFSSVPTVAALLVTMFMWCESNVGYYSVSFFRSEFAFSVTWASTFTLVGKLVGMIGAIAAGLLINRVGRKKMGTITFLVASVLSLTFMFMPTAELSSGLSILNYLFAAMAIAAGGSLILELLPSYRSTVMSLNAVFMNIGMLVSSLVAGSVLNIYGFQAVGLVLGSLGLVGVVVWASLVKEPCAQKKA